MKYQIIIREGLPIHPTEIKMAINKIELPSNVREYRTIQKSIDMDGRDLFVAFEYYIKNDIECIYVSNAVWTKKKRKR